MKFDICEDLKTKRSDLTNDFLSADVEQRWGKFNDIYETPECRQIIGCARFRDIQCECNLRNGRPLSNPGNRRATPARETH